MKLCRHCALRVALYGGSACVTCWDTVQTRFLDFRCSNPLNCPHKVTAAAVRPVR